MDGLFKQRYPDLAGVDWVKRLSPEDQQVFFKLGWQAWEYGKLGGQARAKTARRDYRGRFLPKENYDQSL